MSAKLVSMLPPPPPGASYVEATEPSITFLLIGSTCSASLIPMSFALFFFSNSRVRRQPMFILNAMLVLLGLVEGGVNMYNQTRYLMAEPVSPRMAITFASLAILVPMFANAILFLRVLTVCPPCAVPWTCLFVVYAPIVALKATRLVIEVTFIVTWGKSIVAHADNPFQAGQEAWDTPYPKLAWILQLFDSAYASGVFLLRLKSESLNLLSVRDDGGFGSESTNTDISQDSYYDRVRTLFWISASNFVFPVVLNLAQLVLAFTDSRFLHGAYVLMVNNYVEIVGVLCATVWSTSTKYASLPARGRGDDGRTGGSVSDLQFVAGLPAAEAQHHESPSNGTATSSLRLTDAEGQF